MSKYLYLIDNGHGIGTKNKESIIFKDGAQLKEYLFNRGVAKFLSFMLRQSKIDYEILVPELKDIPIKKGRVVRADEFAKQRECILISIHSDQYFDDTSVNGFATYYISEKGKQIAKVFQKHLGKLGRNRGVKKANFGILRLPKCVAVLTENGFYSNEIECRKLMNPDFQFDIANAHLQAIKELETLNI